MADSDAPLSERGIASDLEQALSGTASRNAKQGGDGGSSCDACSFDAVGDASAARVLMKAMADSSLDPSLDLHADLDADSDTSPTDQEQEMAAIRRRALNLLARREHARAELERKLATKGSPLDAIREALDELQSQGLLSEERFAKSYTASRKERGHGPMRILDELRERKIDDELAAKAVNPEEEGWFDLAARAHRRHFGEVRPDNYPEWARQARFLQRRGFTCEHIRAVLGTSFGDIQG
ncbi:MAG: regulatory protein RecX [Ectothiorhodospiraceae bacterium AqS1]|nr:regulatory protein RecX [Ectothiorhodospiraceae bacterium AqS1]MBF2761632.1 regulatory protein RecX [Ectothiorhodospiraceae bacterium AqS1]